MASFNIGMEDVQLAETAGLASRELEQQLGLQPTPAPPPKASAADPPPSPPRPRAPAPSAPAVSQASAQPPSSGLQGRPTTPASAGVASGSSRAPGAPAAPTTPVTPAAAPAGLAGLVAPESPLGRLLGLGRPSPPQWPSLPGQGQAAEVADLLFDAARLATVAAGAAVADTRRAVDAALDSIFPRPTANPPPPPGTDPPGSGSGSSGGGEGAGALAGGGGEGGAGSGGGSGGSGGGGGGGDGMGGPGEEWWGPTGPGPRMHRLMQLLAAVCLLVPPDRQVQLVRHVFGAVAATLAGLDPGGRAAAVVAGAAMQRRLANSMLLQPGAVGAAGGSVGGVASRLASAAVVLPGAAELHRAWPASDKGAGEGQHEQQPQQQEAQAALEWLARHAAASAALQALDISAAAAAAAVGATAECPTAAGAGGPGADQESAARDVQSAAYAASTTAAMHSAGAGDGGAVHEALLEGRGGPERIAVAAPGAGLGEGQPGAEGHAGLQAGSAAVGTGVPSSPTLAFVAGPAGYVQELAAPVAAPGPPFAGRPWHPTTADTSAPAGPSVADSWGSTLAAPTEGALPAVSPLPSHPVTLAADIQTFLVSVPDGMPDAAPVAAAPGVLGSAPGSAAGTPRAGPSAAAPVLPSPRSGARQSPLLPDTSAAASERPHAAAAVAVPVTAAPSVTVGATDVPAAATAAQTDGTQAVPAGAAPSVPAYALQQTVGSVAPSPATAGRQATARSLAPHLAAAVDAAEEDAASPSPGLPPLLSTHSPYASLQSSAALGSAPATLGSSFMTMVLDSRRHTRDSMEHSGAGMGGASGSESQQLVCTGAPESTSHRVEVGYAAEAEAAAAKLAARGAAGLPGLGAPWPDPRASAADRLPRDQGAAQLPAPPPGPPSAHPQQQPRMQLQEALQHVASMQQEQQRQEQQAQPRPQLQLPAAREGAPSASREEAAPRPGGTPRAARGALGLLALPPRAPTSRGTTPRASLMQQVQQQQQQVQAQQQRQLQQQQEAAVRHLLGDSEENMHTQQLTAQTAAEGTAAGATSAPGAPWQPLLRLPVMQRQGSGGRSRGPGTPVGLGGAGLDARASGPLGRTALISAAYGSQVRQCYLWDYSC